MVHDGRRPGALLKPLRAAVIAASIPHVGPSASNPILACPGDAVRRRRSVAHPGQPGIRQGADVPDRLKGAVRAAVLRCRPVVRRCMNAREQTPAGGRQGR